MATHSLDGVAVNRPRPATTASPESTDHGQVPVVPHRGNTESERDEDAQHHHAEQVEGVVDAVERVDDREREQTERVQPVER